MWSDPRIEVTCLQRSLWPFPLTDSAVLSFDCKLQKVNNFSPWNCLEYIGRQIMLYLHNIQRQCVMWNNHVSWLKVKFALNTFCKILICIQWMMFNKLYMNGFWNEMNRFLKTAYHGNTQNIKFLILPVNIMSSVVHWMVYISCLLIQLRSRALFGM